MFKREKCVSQIGEGSRGSGRFHIWLYLAGITLALAGTAAAVDYQLYNGSWPNEHYDGMGSNTTPGPGLTNPKRLTAVTSTVLKEGFSFLTREPSELYLLGGLAYVPNYISKVDPLTLTEIKRTSLDCPAKDCPYNYIWAPSGSVHLNGFIYAVAESRIWKLDKDLNVITYYNLPIKDGVYNGLKILQDGNLVLKGLGADGGVEERSSLTVLTPDLTPVVAEYTLPEQSVGRMSVLVRGGQQQIYITGKTVLRRYLYTSGADVVLTPDPNWSYAYRNAGDTDTSAAGIAQFIGDEAYFMDNCELLVGKAGGPLPEGPIHLYRVNLNNSADAQQVTPFPGTTKGYHINKQVVDPINGIIVVADATNSKLAGYRYLGANNLTKVWEQPIQTKVIAAASSASKHLYVDDLDPKRGGLYFTVLNTVTGEILNRIPTGYNSNTQAAISIGYNNDVFFTVPTKSMRIYSFR